MNDGLTWIEQAVLPSALGMAEPDKRVVLVYTVFLDDSGTHGEAEVIVAGGFVAPLDAWANYERMATRLYKQYGVSVFHARKFKRNDGDFKGWGEPKKLLFAQGMIDAAKEAGCVGVIVGLDKRLFKGLKQEHDFKHQTSAYGETFRGIIDRLSADNELGPQVREHGLSVMVELGNKNDENLKREFAELRSHDVYSFLDQFSMVPKEKSKPAQLADYMAHFSWLYAEQWPGYDRGNIKEPKMDAWLQLMNHGIRTIGNYVEDIIPAKKRGST